MSLEKLAFRDEHGKVIAVNSCNIKSGYIWLNTGWELKINRVDLASHQYEVNYDSKKHSRMHPSTW